MKQLTKLMLNDFNVLSGREMKSVVGGFTTESGTTGEGTTSADGSTKPCDGKSYDSSCTYNGKSGICKVAAGGSLVCVTN
ncbi:hypothetical protein FACS1894176_10720 [Bacteroidia bacterium]|nr:hypothetical protein FACS1894176_10720 [Bacteroidia bacterium]